MRCPVTSAITSLDLADAISASPAEAAPGTTDAAIAECDVCGHSLDEHDRIARRYCLATTAGAISRGCICG